MKRPSVLCDHISLFPWKVTYDRFDMYNIIGKLTMAHQNKVKYISSSFLGSMAGLGIGMLATGILCGLAGTYMIQRRKNTSVPYELQ